MKPASTSGNGSPAAPSATPPAAPSSGSASAGPSGTPIGGNIAGPTVPVKNKPAAGPELASTSPPPWQRVANDMKAGEEHRPAGRAGLGDTSAEATTRFEDWGYQRSPRSDAYSGAGGVTGFPPAGGVTTGQIGDPAGRTTVNLASATASPRAGATPIPPSATAAPPVRRRPGRGPRRASLQVKRVDPWSVLKLAFVLSVALFFVWMVAVGVLYGVLDGMGVWDKLNGTYTEFAANTSTGGSGPLITASRVFGIAAAIGAVNIILITALATVGAFVYNVSADLAGGLEVTLAERE